MKLVHSLWHYLGFTILSIVITISALEISLFSPKALAEFLDSHPLEKDFISFYPALLEKTYNVTLTPEQQQKAKSLLEGGLKANSLTPFIKSYLSEFLDKFNTPGEDPLATIFPREKIKEPILAMLKTAIYIRVIALPICSTNNVSDCRPNFLSQEQMTDELMNQPEAQKVWAKFYDLPTHDLIPKHWQDLFWVVKKVWEQLIFLNKILIFSLLLLFLVSLILIRHSFAAGLVELGKKFIWYAAPMVIILFAFNFMMPYLVFNFSDRLGVLGKIFVTPESNLLYDFGNLLILKTAFLFGGVLIFGLVLYVLGRIFYKPSTPSDSQLKINIVPPSNKEKKSDITSIYPTPSNLP